ncbi:MAG: DUF6340 family protein [Crocinitomicaceae bacterium]
MKKSNLFLIVVIAIGVVACKQSVFLTITQPPAIYLTPEYTIASVVNRSTKTGNSKIVDILENGVTLEGDLDKKAAEKTIQGLFDRLKNNPQFSNVLLLDSMSVDGGPINEFPVQLQWDQIKSICRPQSSKLLFSLEVFDTDTKVNYSTQNTSQNTPLGKVPLIRHTATVTTIIKTGWRIYDAQQMLILDEFRMTNQVRNTGSGLTPINALAAVLNREQTVLNLSQKIGQAYAERLLEHQIRVNRTYYRSGSPNLKIARRRAMVNDWQGASTLWAKDMASATKRKVIGRATYNMAIYHEINGNLNKALELAKQAYGDHNIKIARDYVIRLERRLNDQQYIK